MPARDSAPFEGFDQIPDPAAGALEQELPAKDAPPPAEPSLTRAERRRRSFIVLALALGWMVVVVARLGLRTDIGTIDVALPVALWIAVAAVGLITALRPRERGLPPTSRAVQLIAAAVPMVFVASALIASRDAEPIALTL